jgi:hypothetical protein
MTAPRSLSTIKLRGKKPELDAFTKRFGPYAKGAILPETTTPSCPRRKVSDFPDGFLKLKWIERLEQDQKLSSCCRHPERHEVEALKSHPEEPCADIYIFHCTCGRKHRFFCVGMTDDQRPEWK